MKTLKDKKNTSMNWEDGSDLYCPICKRQLKGRYCRIHYLTNNKVPNTLFVCRSCYGLMMKIKRFLQAGIFEILNQPEVKVTEVNVK